MACVQRFGSETEEKVGFRMHANGPLFLFRPDSLHTNQPHWPPLSAGTPEALRGWRQQAHFRCEASARGQEADERRVMRRHWACFRAEFPRDEAREGCWRIGGGSKCSQASPVIGTPLMIRTPIRRGMHQLHRQISQHSNNAKPEFHIISTIPVISEVVGSLFCLVGRPDLLYLDATTFP